MVVQGPTINMLFLFPSTSHQQKNVMFIDLIPKVYVLMYEHHFIH